MMVFIIATSSGEKVFSHLSLRSSMLRLAMRMSSVAHGMPQKLQTFVNNKAEAAGGYVLTADVSAIGNGAYQLRMITNKETLTTRVDVVR